jgi:hypothetical protein
MACEVSRTKTLTAATIKPNPTASPTWRGTANNRMGRPRTENSPSHTNTARNTKAAMAAWSNAVSTTAKTSISAGKRSFFTSTALSVIAVAARETPSWIGIQQSSPENRKTVKLEVRSPNGDTRKTVENTKLNSTSCQSGCTKDHANPSSDPA